jgi:RAD51-like protein 3
MRLSSLYHDVPEHLLEALNSLRIVSDVDLLLSSGSPLDIWRRLPPGLLSLQEFNNYVDAILSKASAPGLTADVLITLETLSDLNFGTGVPKLDALLSDFGANHILEISGDTGSGKSVRI